MNICLSGSEQGAKEVHEREEHVDPEPIQRIPQSTMSPIPQSTMSPIPQSSMAGTGEDTTLPSEQYTPVSPTSPLEASHDPTFRASPPAIPLIPEAGQDMTYAQEQGGISGEGKVIII